MMFNKIKAEQNKDDNKIQGAICSTGTIKAEQQEGKLPTIEMDAYNGGIISQYFGDTIVDLDGVEFADNVAILWHHDSEQPIGHATSARVEDGSIKVSAVMSGDPEDANVRKVVTMAKNGFPWQVSIGADITSKEYLEAGEEKDINGETRKGPLVIARGVRVYESSILPLGADNTTSAQVAAKKGSGVVSEHSQSPNLKGDDMDFIKWLKAKGFGDVKDLKDEIKASLEKMYNEEQKSDKVSASKTKEQNEEIKVLQAQLSELKRVDGIKAAAEGHDEIVAKAIEGNWSVDQVEASVKAIEEIRAERSAPAIHMNNKTSEEGAIEASMAMACGVKAENLKGDFSEQAIDQATSIKCSSFSQFAELLLIRAGKFTAGMNVEEKIRAAFSTTGLSNILSNTANKILLNAYMATPAISDQVSSILPVNDFKNVSLNDLTMDLTLEKIGPTGEIKHGTTGDSVQTAKIDSYAKQYTVDRQLLINDDLNAFERVFSGFGKGAMVAEERNFWATYLGFTTVGDLTAALSVDGLTAAMTALGNRVDENGDPIDVSGALLVVPPSLAVLARQLENTTVVNETTTTGKPKPASNPHAGTFTTVVAPYLDNNNVSGGSSTHWYLMASPENVETFWKLRLASQPQPATRRGELAVGQGFGVSTDTVYDFGAVGIDAKNKGVVYSDGTVA